MRKTAFAVVLIIILWGCKGSLTSPSGRDEIVNEWSPFVGVHSFANHTHVQEPHLDRLIQSGNLRGVRMGGDITHASNTMILADFLDSRGVEILSIFPNEYLRDPNVLDIFAQTINAFPMVNDWEIGNEVTHFVKMEPEEYMPIFKKIFYFAKENFPEKNIIAQAPVGSGGGPERLKKMIDLGLLDMFDDGLTTVTLHFYSWKSIRLDEFKSQVSRLPYNRRIWVTETNADAFDVKPEDQVKYVNTHYRRMINALGAERIYWYVFSECTSLSLVHGLAPVCALDPPLYSPLMKFLVGDIQ